MSDVSISKALLETFGYKLALAPRGSTAPPVMLVLFGRETATGSRCHESLKHVRTAQGGRYDATKLYLARIVTKGR